MSWKKWKKICAAALLLGCAVQLAGCRTTELEDRSFPMLAAVALDESKQQVGFTYVFPILRAEPDAADEAGDDPAAMEYAGNFAQAWEKYEDSLNKIADYNHLKVLLMSRSFLEDKEQYEAMLTLLQEKEIFPRNTYQLEDVLKAEKNLKEDLGTYIEELLENHEFGRETRLPTLGDLMDEKENKRRTWNLPYLSVKEDTILWEGSVEK